MSIVNDIIPNDFVEELCEKSEKFKLGRNEFLEKFKNQIVLVVDF